MTPIVAETHDPEAGQLQPCPCHTFPSPRGTERGWHERKGPGPVLRARTGMPECGHPAEWIDHPYRLRLADGRWAYVVEPYELSGDAFADLAYLDENGFDVHVNTWEARHYPGHTLAVVITPRGGTP